MKVDIKKINKVVNGIINTINKKDSSNKVIVSELEAIHTALMKKFMRYYSINPCKWEKLAIDEWYMNVMQLMMGRKLHTLAPLIELIVVAYELDYKYMQRVISYGDMLSRFGYGNNLRAYKYLKSIGIKLSTNKDEWASETRKYLYFLFEEELDEEIIDTQMGSIYTRGYEPDYDYYSGCSGGGSRSYSHC